MQPINTTTWTGYPPGTVRLLSATSIRPPWWRRLWNWLRRRRPDAIQVTYSFSRVQAPES